MGIANKIAQQAVTLEAKVAKKAISHPAQRAAVVAKKIPHAPLGADSLQLTAKATHQAVARGSAAVGSLKLKAPAGAIPQAKASGAILDLSFNDTYKETIALNEALAKANPRNTDKQLFKLIDGAKTRIDGAFYDIEDKTVTDKLIAAKKRGVDVRLVTDTDNMVEKIDPKMPREAIKRLKAAGIPIVDDQRSAIMHHKFMVVDGKKVWAGSTNLTPSSLYRHNNNALTIQSKELSNSFQDEFQRLFEKREFGASTRPELPPVKPVHLKNGDVQVFFSPMGGGKDAVVKELQGAKKSISFMTFSLTDASISQAMRDKAKAGVKVEGIFDRWLAAGEYSQFQPFKRAGIPVWKDGNEALMHHKVMIVDQKTVITGSFNFSQNAEHNNNEAFFIIRNAQALAKDYEAEFKRIKYAAEHNHPPAAIKKPDAEVTSALKTEGKP